MSAKHEMHARVKAAVREHERVQAALRSQGWTVRPSQGSLAWLGFGKATAGFAGACDRAGIAVRSFDGEGVQVSIGSPAQNNACLAVTAVRTDQDRTPIP